MEKAIERNKGNLKKKLCGNLSFKASAGWLDKFKLRRGIRLLFIEGEKLGAGSAAIPVYREKYRSE
jgi:Tc5 transposase DNA-binding domain.